MRLGSTSGNICTIDVDQDQWVKPLIEANPFLAKTLATRGQRGAQFWLKMPGDFPHRKITFKTRKQVALKSKGHVAEFRTDGCKSVIRGNHPNTGKPYQVLVEARPIEITYDQIVWPSEWVVASTKPEAPKTKKDRRFRAEAGTDAGPLNRCLVDHIRELCLEFFPEGHEEGSEWRIGDVSGARGQSVGIDLSPEKAGLWYEFNGEEGGGFLELLARSRDITRTKAFTLIKRRYPIYFAKDNPEQKRAKELLAAFL